MAELIWRNWYCGIGMTELVWRNLYGGIDMAERKALNSMWIREAARVGALGGICHGR